MVHVVSIEQNVGPASLTEWVKLTLSSPQASVLRAKCIRYDAGDHPIVVEEVVLALDHFPGLTAKRGDVSDIVELARRYGVSLALARERVSIVPASKDVALILAIAVGAKVAKMDRIVAAVGGDPVEWRVAFTNISSGEPRRRQWQYPQLEA